MKKFSLIIFLFALTYGAYAQFGSIHRRALNETRKRVKYNANKKAEEETREVREEGLKAAEEGVNAFEAWYDPYYGEVKMFVDENLIEESDVQWQRLQFVPGKEIIFYDKPFNYEARSKHPTMWYVDEESNGEVQVDALDQGEALLLSGPGYISPKFKGSNGDYLSDNFTLSFDFMMPVSPYAKPMYVNFYGIENKNLELAAIKINKNFVTYKDSTSRYPVMAYDENGMYNWYRISVEYNKGILNVYMNERKMISYKEDFNPTGITITYEAITPIFLHNFMLAKNAESIHDQLAAGSYTSYNIDYLMNKSKLSGPSIAELSSIALELINHPEMKLEADVYFSQSKKEKENEEYGKQKAEAIKKILVSMGANEDQISTTYKGFILSSKDNPKNYLSEAVIFRTKN
jgi:outer membrane protein OmpA-like peptidoglycan-associated protein